MSKLNKNEKQTLLKLARDTITKYITERSLPPLPPIIGTLAEERGAFVTLHRKGHLRGCIGHMIGTKPLANTVQEMAIAAATQDPRFDPIRIEELKEIDIEISVLSPLEAIKDVNKIEVGRHGIMMRRGFYSGVLLPQVATEQGWDRETFLTHTCYKAGLSGDAWKDKDTIIEIFEAEVFGEKDV